MILLNRRLLTLIMLFTTVESHVVGDKAFLAVAEVHYINPLATDDVLSLDLSLLVTTPVSAKTFSETKNLQIHYLMWVCNQEILTELKKLCEHAYICFHDNIIICGKSVNEARTFLDLCDLYEYSCEYNMVFRHVKEEEGVCPNPKELTHGVG